MKKIFGILLIGLMILIGGNAYAVKKIKKNKAYYEKRYVDPVIKEMMDRDKKLLEEEQKKTAEINKTYGKIKKEKRESRKVLRFSFEGIKKPSSPQEFKQVFYFPPVAQYLTGTCWDFSTTSFFESEVFRLTGKKIKLSEMWTAYYEYVEKARNFVKERGHSEFGQGSESDAVPSIWEKYGIVPLSEYKGVLAKDGRYDHNLMFREMRDYLNFCKEKNYWDEKVIISQIRLILDKYMGSPPEKFQYNGKIYTPMQFLKEVLGLDLDNYVSFMSTLSQPFYEKGIFDVPDNWRRSKDYYNVPLDDFYRIIKYAITHGYSVATGGDVSEPGYNGKEDAAIVSTFDIPPQYIDQSSREYRIFNHTTTDDHGIHLVGYEHIGNWDWFLIKDSARSSRWGKFKGYYFYREDYIKLKMLTSLVPKDAAGEILAKFKSENK